MALNKERRAEEEQGLVRYLRPEYQAPEEAQAQAALELDVEVHLELRRTVTISEKGA